MDLLFALTTILFYVSIILLPFSVLGMVTVFYWIKKAPLPVDQSNVFNSVRLWWFALTRRDKFVDLFPWLRNDEWDNIND